MTREIPARRTVINDKLGRPVSIDDRPRGWKLTPRERDLIYQKFLAVFPSDSYDKEGARKWMTLEAAEWSISPKRIQDFIREADQA